MEVWNNESWPCSQGRLYLYCSCSLPGSGNVFWFWGGCGSSFCGAGMLFYLFFRNPDRTIPTDEHLVVSPADGTVQDVVELEDDDFVKGPCTKIIIFLSVFNVHVNRSPIAGEIKCQKYVCGRFRPAYKDEVGFENERHMLGIENEKGFRVTVTQIAGILARRIVSWVTLDDNMSKGQVYGLIKFGSCTELVVPRNVEVLVKKGDKVRGGESVLGRIK